MGKERGKDGRKEGRGRRQRAKIRGQSERIGENKQLRAKEGRREGRVGGESHVKNSCCQ